MKKLDATVTQRLEADANADLQIKKHDRFLNLAQFNAANRDVLMVMEIHELLESELIDLVVEEPNAQVDCAVHETKEGKKILVVDPRAPYQKFREVYDELTK